jgi:hypothetical protein
MMTEAEFEGGEDPKTMLAFLVKTGKFSDRKYRLFACACLRRIFGSTGQETCPELSVSERFADGQATNRELKRIRSRLGAMGGYSSAWAVNCMEHAILEPKAATAAASAIAGALAYASLRVMEQATPDSGLTWDDLKAEATIVSRKEGVHLAHVLRDIFGLVLRPTVFSLAEAAYAKRDLPSGHLDVAGLAVLADALEEAGCDDHHLLAHLRGPGPHVRGCFVLDTVLEKE